MKELMFRLSICDPEAKEELSHRIIGANWSIVPENFTRRHKLFMKDEIARLLSEAISAELTPQVMLDLIEEALEAPIIKRVKQESEDLIQKAEEFKNDVSDPETKEMLSEFIDGFTKLKDEFVKSGDRERFFGENIKEVIDTLKGN